MARRKKIDKYQQLDIIAALYGKEVPIEEKQEEVATEKKAVNLFDFVKDIRQYKNGNMLDEEQNLSSFDTYMILRALGMKESDIPFCKMASEFSSVLDKKQMYNLLLELIDKDPRGFYRFIPNEKEQKHELIGHVVSYFKCSEKEAFEYITIMGDEWAEKIKEKFGDFEIE